MIIKQKIMRNVSLTAHPTGCAAYVQEQLDYLKSQPLPANKDSYPKRVLVIGGSTGYGLASRMVAAVVGGAASINVSFEREPAENKVATPGWYNTVAFEREAKKMGLYAQSIFGDAFSTGIKEQTAALVKQHLGQVDLIVYSLASPMRIDPVTGQQYKSVLKPIGKTYTALSVDVPTGIVETAVIEPAEGTQVEETVKVMGGEDWQLWIEFLFGQGLLAKGFKTVAYSYIGPEITFPVYREGTIGKAKEHLERTAGELTRNMSIIDGEAYVSVNKALVTRASAVIPVVPLYIALLYKVMKEMGLHEECTRQIHRLFTDRLYRGSSVPVDVEGRIRLDDWEMRPDVQAEVDRRWAMQKEGSPMVGGDLDGFKEEYDHIHGFGYASVDYSVDVDPREV
ncbi:MAG: enoyl-ACP reductase FabV [Sphaerochaeta sp.]|jgi:enoyl-[acyl-carrier protein] reductase/trans-2-enoyl-CoA reductase (NAD+)|nr:enoyl-ACP reductase FabV [Sphaerochaeta sp.]PKL29411.1 MAG: enoyl-[acyl-carrier-protein] reductase FabV [Spirochaetae bacterium HGW-Spirochaetae-2]